MTRALIPTRTGEREVDVTLTGRERTLRIGSDDISYAEPMRHRWTLVEVRDEHGALHWIAEERLDPDSMRALEIARGGTVHDERQAARERADASRRRRRDAARAQTPRRAAQTRAAYDRRKARLRVDACAREAQRASWRERKRVARQRAEADR